MRDFAKRFYNSKAWKDCRQSYIHSVFGICERCAQPGKIVHHKVYLSPKNINDPYVALNHKNLELLCQDCHNAEHMAKLPIAMGLRFTPDGDVIASPPVYKKA